MAKESPGKSHREGITLVQLMDHVPDRGSRGGVVRIGRLGRTGATARNAVRL